jgi:type IV pilus assembly protein PilX
MKNAMQSYRRSRHTSSRRPRQRGVTLLIAIIALVVMTVGALALVRSTQTSLRLSGNLAFKRDLANQAERGIALAVADLRTGALSSNAARASNVASRNYSATRLTSSTQGIPNILFDDAAFTSAFTRADVSDTGIAVRYVIDRLCTTTGTFDATSCAFVSRSARDIKGEPDPKNLGSINSGIYRISVRVTGPRGVQSFVQTTMALN